MYMCMSCAFAPLLFRDHERPRRDGRRLHVGPAHRHGFTSQTAYEPVLEIDADFFLTCIGRVIARADALVPNCADRGASKRELQTSR